MDLVSGHQQLLKSKEERHSDIMCLLMGENNTKQKGKTTFDQTSRFTNQFTEKNRRKKVCRKTPWGKYELWDKPINFFNTHSHNKKKNK